MGVGVDIDMGVGGGWEDWVGRAAERERELKGWVVWMDTCGGFEMRKRYPVTDR